MSEFPKLKNLRKRFNIAASNANEMERQRLTEIFKKLQEACITREEFEYNGNLDWIDNAHHENDLFPFRAIVSNKNPQDYDEVIIDSELDTSIDKKWQAARSIIVKRNASDMADAIGPMLYNCHTAIFIDPWFRPREKRFREPLAEFLSRFESRPKSKVRVEVHASAESEKSPDSEFYKNECRSYLPQVIPSNMSVGFKRWRQKLNGEKLHNRYVLTDIGGVSFQIGLDQGGLGETDDLSLLDSEQFRRRWHQYASSSPAFEQAEESFSIVGIRE